jgi:hypothetical protein
MRLGYCRLRVIEIRLKRLRKREKGARIVAKIIPQGLKSVRENSL